MVRMYFDTVAALRGQQEAGFEPLSVAPSKMRSTLDLLPACSTSSTIGKLGEKLANADIVTPICIFCNACSIGFMSARVQAIVNLM